ncbi:UDP-N-acetylmuramate dehydrogenase [Nocardia colli]|uniref:UDP-N-acetylenolpyruvoylglucosamine reductase n=1 Tax=Nocardia colli TaxID=2545717 RepID=A0A5N0ENQ4_9NOCA|nr:UDP-N-acetylmuramate dehydrogenase [Nocardia colli]
MRVAGRVRQRCSHGRTRYRLPVRTSRVVPSDVLAATGARIRESVPLAELTTLRVGGPATVAECTTTESLVATVRALDAAGLPVLLIAGGSNLLISDDGFDGVVVRVATGGVELGADGVLAEAGANWDAVVAATVSAGLGGLECLSGIPGSAGATPVQNVGAYGAEVANLLRRVRLLDRHTGEIRWAEPGELGFGYRTSVLKHRDDALVLAVEFALDPTGASAPLRYGELATTLGAADGESRPAAEVRDAVLRLRAGKGMVLDPADHDTWSAGSFFTNPVVPEDRVPEVRAAIAAYVGDVTVPTYPAPDGVKFSAGWLIERAGFAKGFPGPDAPARLSTKHTLALTNRGAATAADLADLARTVRDGVAARFGIRLEPEPVTVDVPV